VTQWELQGHAHAALITSTYIYPILSFLLFSFFGACSHTLLPPFSHSPLSENITPLENQIVELAAGIYGIQAEQDYMKIREQAHCNFQAWKMHIMRAACVAARTTSSHHQPHHIIVAACTTTHARNRCVMRSLES
jgi:hypothetical protein